MKKNVLFQKTGLVLITAAVLTCGCSKSDTKEQAAPEKDAVKEAQTETQPKKKAESETKEEKDSSAEKEEQPSKDELNVAKIRCRYVDILSGLALGGQWPDGRVYSPYDGSGTEENHYAIMDIDGDGLEELIVSLKSGASADMTECIYGYNPADGSLHEELIEFPLVDYYDNGIITAGLSHNQGLGESLWPFTLYQYDKQGDIYTEAGSVDSWEKSFMEQDYNGNPFPDELDTDGDGILYYIAKPGNVGEVSPVNQKEYDEWYQSYIGTAKKLEIPYEELKAEHFEHYTSEYLKLLREQALKNGLVSEKDIGLFYMENDADLDKLIENITSAYPITLADGSYEMEKTGIYDGKDVIYINYEDSGTVTYQNEKVSDLTVFGLYPGISEQEAVACLEKFGFYKDERGDYVTGDGWGNYKVGWNVENGIVSGISFYKYCRYTG